MNQLHPIEIALSDWLLSGPGNVDMLSASAVPAGGAPSVEVSLLQRIRQRIDGGLSDSQLTPDTVAAHAGVSTRTLQKLFGTIGDTFTHYLRRQRLERCRADLANPLLLHLAICDICTRWGFSDAAHFSRAFRERYQRSPRAYRRETGVALSKRVWLRAARAVEKGPQFDPGSPAVLETVDAWVVCVEAPAVQLLGSATTVLYHRMAQELVSLHGTDQNEAWAAVELGMEIVITPGKRGWQVRGTLSKARLPFRMQGESRQGDGTARSLCSS